MGPVWDGSHVRASLPPVTSGQGSPSECDRDPWLLHRFVDSLGYFGLSLQVGDFGLDIYLTQLIFGAVEVPARYSSIFMMQWLGRKWSQLGTLVLGGLMCIAIIFVPAGTWAGIPHHLGPEAHCLPS